MFYQKYGDSDVAALTYCWMNKTNNEIFKLLLSMYGVMWYFQDIVV